MNVALSTADILQKTNGMEAEVIDLRTLRPIDYETIIGSVKKTSRAIVIEEGWKTGGFSAEIASSIQEQAFDYLDGPVVRIGGEDVPTPYSGQLEAAVFPSTDQVLEAFHKNFGVST